MRKGIQNNQSVTGWLAWSPLKIVLCSGLNTGFICWQAQNSAGAVTISASILCIRLAFNPWFQVYFSIKQLLYISFLRPPKYFKLGDLTQQTFILFQYWRWEVWNQVVGKVDSYWRPWGKTHYMPLFYLWRLPATLAVSWQKLQSLLLSSCGLLPCMSLCLRSSSFFSYKNANHWI